MNTYALITLADALFQPPWTSFLAYLMGEGFEVELIQMFCHHIYECVTYNLWHFWKVKKSSQDVEQNKEQNLSCNAVHRVKSLLTFLLIDFNKTWKKTPALVFCWVI